ncbi:hypothetical protein BZA77DRAFT_356661 [Pyronema omphalodes]|nr:hypothetical protein BZA77DRAFT_356661 [Pyronema omphalodes]
MAALSCPSDSSTLSTLPSTVTAGSVPATCLKNTDLEHHCKAPSLGFPYDRHESPWSPFSPDDCDKRKSRVGRVLHSVSDKFGDDSTPISHTANESISPSSLFEHGHITYPSCEILQTLRFEDGTITQQQHCSNEDFEAYQGIRSPVINGSQGVSLHLNYSDSKHQYAQGNYGQDSGTVFTHTGFTTERYVICPAFSKKNTKNSPDNEECRKQFQTLEEARQHADKHHMKCCICHYDPPSPEYKDESRRHIKDIHLKVCEQIRGSHTTLENLKELVQKAEYKELNDLLLFQPNRGGQRRKKYDYTDGTNCLPQDASPTEPLAQEQPVAAGRQLHQREHGFSNLRRDQESATDNMILNQILRNTQAILNGQMLSKKRGPDCISDDLESNSAAHSNKRIDRGLSRVDTAAETFPKNSTASITTARLMNPQSAYSPTHVGWPMAPQGYQDPGNFNQRPQQSSLGFSPIGLESTQQAYPWGDHAGANTLGLSAYGDPEAYSPNQPDQQTYDNYEVGIPVSPQAVDEVNEAAPPRGYVPILPNDSQGRINRYPRQTNE